MSPSLLNIAGVISTDPWPQPVEGHFTQSISIESFKRTNKLYLRYPGLALFVSH
jgi:hypothetical protein